MKYIVKVKIGAIDKNYNIICFNQVKTPFRECTSVKKAKALKTELFQKYFKNMVKVQEIKKFPISTKIYYITIEKEEFPKNYEIFRSGYYRRK